MLVASSPFPNIRFSTCSSSSFSTLRFSNLNIFTIRCSQSDGPLRRPVASPPLVKPVPSSPLPLVKPSPPPSSLAVALPIVSPKPAVPWAVKGKRVVTLEFQRQKAKELQEYFKQKKIEEANQGSFFGFIAKNEISNGR